MRILILAVLLFLVACELPTEPEVDCAMRHGCKESVAVPLSDAEVQLWLEEARKDVRARIASGQMGPPSSWSAPEIEWRPCPFFIENSNFGPVCAAGVTKSYANKIVICTWERERRGPLVAWEFRNLLFIRAGRKDLAI
jgi:hypothetical protein